jgi:hypothetical protein
MERSGGRRGGGMKRCQWRWYKRDEEHEEKEIKNRRR